MQKKYIVRLMDEERGELHEVVKKLKGTGQKVRRAQILLKADAEGPNWTDQRIAEAFLVEGGQWKRFANGWSKEVSGDARRSETRTSGDREAVQWRPGGPRDCHASRVAAERVRQLDAAAAGPQGRGVGNCGFHQLRNRPAHAKKNGMTNRKNRILGHSARKQTPNSRRTWKTCWKPTKNRMIRNARCCAWTSSQCNCSRRLGSSHCGHERTCANGSITNTSGRARQTSSCSPNRWPDGVRRRSERRKRKVDWAVEMARLLEGRYRECEKVILVCDNLNTHTKGAFYEAFEPDRARQRSSAGLNSRHTPKHGSWLNIAENELSSLTRQCVSGRRIGDIQTLQEETSAWSTDVNSTPTRCRLANENRRRPLQTEVRLSQNQRVTKH